MAAPIPRSWQLAGAASTLLPAAADPTPSAALPAPVPQCATVCPLFRHK
jgi:hypothetical protein